MKLRLQHSKALIKSILQAHSLSLSLTHTVIPSLSTLQAWIPTGATLYRRDRSAWYPRANALRTAPGMRSPRRASTFLRSWCAHIRSARRLNCVRWVSIPYPTLPHAGHVYLHSLLQLGNSKPMLMSKLTLQIRQTEELPPIAHDSNIDVAYQDFRRLPQSVHSMPGDRLIAECIYDSSSRKAITLGKC